MTSFLSASAVTTEMEVEFPNLFGGMAINYYRGFQLFGINVYWYGILITAGVVLAYLYAVRRSEKDFGLSRDRVFDVVFASIVGGFLGARIYFCVFTELKAPGSYNFVTMFTTIRDGGLAIYGGIIGAVLTGLVFCKIRRVNFFAMTDLAALGFLIGQTIGRWGNFINQEAYGEICSPDWILGMSGSKIRAEVEAGALVHPCFLYESVWCLAGFVFLHVYSKKLRTYDGEIALLYVAWYGFGRTFIEGMRTDSLMAGSVRVSRLLAAVSFAAALAAFIVFKIAAAKRGTTLYVRSEASKELLERDREAEEAKKAKKEKNAPSILSEEFSEDSGENVGSGNDKPETVAESAPDDENSDKED